MSIERLRAVRDAVRRWVSLIQLARLNPDRSVNPHGFVAVCRAKEQAREALAALGYGDREWTVAPEPPGGPLVRSNGLLHDTMLQLWVACFNESKTPTLETLEYIASSLKIELEQPACGDPTQKAKPDGLFPPDGFRWHGDQVTGLSQSENNLLTLLWADDATPCLEISELAKAYAKARAKPYQDERGAMLKMYGRLKDKLELAKVAQIVRDNHTLQLVRVQATSGRLPGDK